MSEKNLSEEQIPTVDSATEEMQEETLEQVEEAVSEDISALLDEAREEASKHKDMALRLQADMENLRRRTRLDIESAHKYALEKFVDALLPAMDSMEMGIQAAAQDGANIENIREGVEMTFKQMIDVLQNFNVERIDPKGEKFNPQDHEALTMIPSPEHESQTVVDVIQKGYKLNERLVRPARVIVAQ
ncbi:MULTISPECIES: nucleotide exchange factor GrpE [Thiomicrorhabdus]|uniref:Protein GrpE n=1 Tax=Thiomicrorhabdus heinhorstiae TaxID=2748010 RepID=A0ABS0BYG7_9GAMM|nr:MULTISPECIES: nucleotide exchange factor GrpE [Thiomicrorhabdus]MBF6057891.1 nucleotide exchange factor GrpE [Thiomicrorhabdus heinhorstiae]